MVNDHRFPTAAVPAAVFQRLAAGASDAMGWLSRDGRLLFANDACTSLLPNADRRNFSDCFSAADWDTLCERILPQVFDGGEWEGEFAGRNGAARGAWYCFPVCDAAGQVTAAGFRRSAPVHATPPPVFDERSYLMQLIDHVDAIVYLKRADDLHYAAVNSRAARMVDRSVPELLGKNDYDVFPAPMASAFVDEDRDVLRRSDPLRIMETVDMPDGTRRTYFTEKSVLRDAGGKPAYVLGILVDRTAEKRMGEAYEKERHFNRSLLDAAPAAVLLIDDSGRIAYINPYLERLSGYGLNEVLYADWLNTFVPERLREHVGDLLVQVQQRRSPYVGSGPLLTRDGSERFMEWHSQVVQSSLYEGRSVLCIGQDITERRQSEQEIQRLASIVRFSQDFIGVSDLEGRPHYLNEAGRKLVGITSDKHLFRTLVPEYFPEPERHTKVPAILRQVLEQGRWVGEIDFQHLQSGERIPVLFDIFRIDDPASGDPINFATVTRDIRELKRNEALLKEVQTIAELGSWDLNLIDNELTWSEETFAIFGLSPASFTPNFDGFMERVHPEDREKVRAAYAEHVASRRPYEVTHRICLPDGSVKHVVERCTTTFGADGKPTRSLGSVQDVTRQVETAMALQRLNDELEQRVEARTRELVAAREAAEQASNAKSQFLSRVSHELRTPLNAILGFAQLLRWDQNLEADQQNSIEEILGSGRHLLELINDVLQLSHIESGDYPLSMEQLQLHDLIRASVAIVQPMADDMEVNLDVSAGCHIAVLADPLRLKQVLVNLLTNAVKYNRRLGAVRVFCEPLPGRVRIGVMDTGVGIDPRRVDELFEPFNRLHQDESIEGTGIGLSIAKQLTEAMHGRISVSSRPGAGTTVWVELPCAAAAAQAQPPTGTTAPDSRQVEGLSVLYVEDHRANFKLVEALLKRAGAVRVHHTRSARGGLRLLSRLPVDLVLMDLQLPDTDGFEALRRLRGNPAFAHIPVIALSASSNEETVARGLKAGFAACLPKPVDLEQLLRIIAQVQPAGERPR